MRLPEAFDGVWYRKTYSDTNKAFGGAALHWLRHGRYEGRFPCHIEAAIAEAALWSGQQAAIGRLIELAQGAERTEAVCATIALARVAAAQGDWDAAGDRLAQIDPKSDLLEHLGMPEPFLFCGQTALQLGQTEKAKALATLAEKGFGRHPALYFLQAGLADQDRPDDRWSDTLRPLYSSARLPSPQLDRAKSECRFDQVMATCKAPVTNGPLVSVIVPARDAGRTLDTALAGLVAQSWRSLEILAVDNGSTDDTLARMQAWAARDSRIQVIDGGAAKGAYGARNLGLSLAKGQLITLQDADDWSHPERIRRQAEELLAKPSIAANLSFWVRLSEDLQVGAIRPDVGVIHPNLSSLMLRRETIERLGFWDQVKAGADTEYIGRLTCVFGTSAIAHVLPGVPLAFGRIRGTSLSQTKETGLFLGPGAAARSTYLAAARHWHQSSGSHVYLPQHPETRPFPVPAELDLP